MAPPFFAFPALMQKGRKSAEGWIKLTTDLQKAIKEGEMGAILKSLCKVRRRKIFAPEFVQCAQTKAFAALWERRRRALKVCENEGKYNLPRPEALGRGTTKCAQND